MNEREDDNKEDQAVRMRRSKRKVCAFCVDKAESIDYKDVAKLRKYVTERGKIYQEEFLEHVLSTKDN